MAMRRPRIKVTANLINPKRKEIGPKPAARPAAVEDKSGQASKAAEDGFGVNALAENTLVARNDAKPRDEIRDASNEQSGVVAAQLENVKELEVAKSIKSHSPRRKLAPQLDETGTQPTEKEQIAADDESGLNKSEAFVVADSSLVVTQPAVGSLTITQKAETINKTAEVNSSPAVSLDTPITNSSTIAENEIPTQGFENSPSAPVFQQKKIKTEPRLDVTKPIDLTFDQKATGDAPLSRYEVLEDSTIAQPSLQNSTKRFIQPAAAADFKCPPNVAVFYANNEHDASESAIEDDIIKKDLQQSAHSMPISTTKSRQRIKATPIFGQRRNSMQSTATGDEATTTNDSTPPTRQRERHYSGSQYHPYTNPVASPQYNSPHKAIPHSVGRIRTESNCSVYSDVSITKSSRKGDDHNQRPSSRRDYEARFSQGVPDKSKLKMFDLLYYNPNTNPIIETADEAALLKKNRREKDEFLSSTASVDIKHRPSSPDLREERNSEPVPQLKLNAKGELILDDSTLEIENSAEQKARVALANSKLIHLDATTGMNGFYKRQKRTKEWSNDETVKFYRALQRLGTAFSLMEQLFPDRTRRDLKLKFKKEERCNLHLINKAILSPRAFELDELKKQLEEEDKAKAELEEKWMEIKTTEGKLLKKVRTKSAGERALSHGDEVYEMENVPSTNISKRAIKKMAEMKAQKEAAISESVKPKRKYIKRKQAEPTGNEDATQEGLPVKKKIKRKRKLATPNKQASKVEHVILLDDQLEYEISDLLDIAAAESQDSEGEGLEEAEVETKVLDTEDCVQVADWAAERDHENVSPVGSPEPVDELAAEGEVDHSNLECVEEINEQRKEHLQKLFEDLCSGCLAVVTSEDPDEPGQLRNDIYMLDKASGELCDRPLELPDDIRDSILAVWEECS